MHQYFPFQATAHLFRNLAWKADKTSKQTLSDSNVVPVLMQAAIEVARASGTLQPDSTKKDPTLEVILSALWNLSSHSRKNKVRIGLYIHFANPQISLPS